MKKTQKRRRREKKTDYSKRINLLKSQSPRIIFRKTNRYIICQYVLSKEAQDIIKKSFNSRELLKYGWPKEFQGSLKSLPAAYLTGFIIGKKISKEKESSPIVDAGMNRIIPKNRFFAFLKGLKDSGVNVKCDEKFFPDEFRISGRHLKRDFSKIFLEIKSKIQKE
ncbi:MAG: 50S ribosomal protein L18 [Candidatus Pacearchaeota archaeon]